MKPVDAHCHLDFERFDEDREEVIARAIDELEFVVNAGRDAESNRETIKIADRYPEFVLPCLGLHPTYTDSFNEVEDVVGQLQDYKVPVGEIGLDYHHVNDEKLRGRQRDVFRMLLEAAEDLKRPVIVHSRDSEEDVLEILSGYDLEVFLHCFNGSVDLANKAVEQGAMIGVTTQVLYSSRVQSIVEEVGLDNLLLETDSPFLYPDGRNEPVNVLESADKIAGLKDISVAEVVDRTSANAEEFFR